MKKIFICLTILFSVFLFTNKINALETTTGEYPNIPEGSDNFVIIERDNNYGYLLFAWNSSSTVYVHNNNNNSLYFSTSSINVGDWNRYDVSVYKLESNEWVYWKTTNISDFPFAQIIATNVDLISSNGGTPYKAGYGLVNKNNLFNNSSDNFLYGGFTKENLKTIINYNRIDTSIYDSVIIYYGKPSDTWRTMDILFYSSTNENRLNIDENNIFLGILNGDNINIVTEMLISDFTTNISNIDMQTIDYNRKIETKEITSHYVTNGGEILYKGLVSNALGYNPNVYNINFHLNDGIVTDFYQNNYYEDYSIKLFEDNFKEYLLNQTIEKETMIFQGWYYDQKFTKKLEITDKLNSDINLYAKWGYVNVEDFLNNTTFNSYTFDENYQYAVISLNSQENRDIYLGLDVFVTNLEVYKYLKNDNSYSKENALCLTPIYSKEDKYYYQINDSSDNNYEVLIIPKEKLMGKYNFLLSDNAYVTYTNDLKDLVIKDESGNDIHTDIEDVYNYYQDVLLNGENDLLEIFKDLINNKDNNVFSYFNQVWNYLKRNKLFTYFMTLIIGSLIILIIKAASR